MTTEMKETEKTYEFNSNLLTELEMSTFIGKNKDKFNLIIGPIVRKYNKDKTKVVQKYSPHWQLINWWALLTSYFWFFYRKMYFIAILFIIGSTYLNYILSEHHIKTHIISFLPMFLANRIYIEYCAWTILKLKKKLVKKNEIPKSENEFLDILKEKGGVSWKAGLLSFIILTSLFLMGLYANSMLIK